MTIPRPCLTCGTPTTNGSRCPEHTRTQTERRGINGWKWAALRARIIQRDGYACTRCGATHSLEVHHVTPVVAGGSQHPRNLATLCHACHHAQHHGVS